jgi:16S rRNA (adenine1518-N6/adenine1519-N6)-dimethyltransferase
MVTFDVLESLSKDRIKIEIKKGMRVQAKKGLGQHFLKDKGIAKRIVDLLEPQAQDIILEIGPGMGVLTEFLLEKFGERVHVVEIDKESVEYLETNFPELQGRIYNADFLKMDLGATFKSKLAVIGNFPYNISTQILFHLLDSREQVSQVIGMFQREVARRITIGPGTKEYGILSVLLEAYFTRKYVFTVPENVFQPPPKVKSGVLVLEKKGEQPVELNHVLFRRVVKAAFNQRRKTLRNSLGMMLPTKDADIPLLKLRPEQLDLNGFIELVRFIESDSFGAQNL